MAKVIKLQPDFPNAKKHLDGIIAHLKQIACSSPDEPDVFTDILHFYH